MPERIKRHITDFFKEGHGRHVSTIPPGTGASLTGDAILMWGSSLALLRDQVEMTPNQTCDVWLRVRDGTWRNEP